MTTSSSKRGVVEQLLSSMDEGTVNQLAKLLTVTAAGHNKEQKEKVVEEPGIGDPLTPGQSDTSSWADEMNSEASAVSGVPVIAQHVRDTVKFGGFGEVGADDGAVASRPGTMAQYVRTDQARGMRKVLQSYGVKLPTSAAWHLALVTHTAATVPNFFSGGKEKLRTLAVLGDAAMVVAVAASAIARGHTLESVQRTRTTVLTDGELQRIFSDSQLRRFVSFASGVDPKHAKTGATALEAVVGVVSYYCPPNVVRELLRNLGVLE